MKPIEALEKYGIGHDCGEVLERVCKCGLELGSHACCQVTPTIWQHFCNASSNARFEPKGEE